MSVSRILCIQIKTTTLRATKEIHVVACEEQTNRSKAVGKAFGNALVEIPSLDRAQIQSTISRFSTPLRQLSYVYHGTYRV